MYSTTELHSSHVEFDNTICVNAQEVLILLLLLLLTVLLLNQLRESGKPS